MKEQKIKIPLLISLGVHLALLLLWTVSESLFPLLEGEKPEEPREDRFVFEVIETPDVIPEEMPDDVTNLVSDKNTRATDMNPLSDEHVDIPYAEGDFEIKQYELPERDGVESGVEDMTVEGAVGGDIGDLAKLELPEENDPGAAGDSKPIDFKNLIASMAGKGGMSFNTYEWDFAPYMLAMKRKVEKYLHPPYAFTQMGLVSGTNVVRFTVMRDGSISGIEMLGSDAHFSLDRTSLRAIELAAPFLPLPRDFPEEELEVTAQFSYLIR